MTASDTDPPVAPELGALSPTLKSLTDLARRFGQAGERESARLICEATATLRQELAKHEDELAELRRQLATTRAYIGILS
jgi:hypothetical protein